MEDTKKSAPRRSKAPANPEAKAFGIITTALEELPTEVVHRVLDHAAKMYGFYVVTDLPTLAGSGEQTTPYGGHFDPPVERTFDPAPVPE